MAIDTQTDLFEDKQPTETVTEAPAHTPEPAPEAKPQKMSVREALDDAVRQDRARDEAGRFAKEPPKPDKPAVKAEAPAQAVEKSSEAAPKGPPTAWSKEAKGLWDSLPPSIQAEAHRREADTAKGVQQLQSRYQDLDRAIAPYQGMMQQRGLAPAQVWTALTTAYMRLADPNKEAAKQAFLLLARSMNVDLSTQGSASPASQGASPSSLSPEIAQHLNSLTSRVQAAEGEFAQQRAAAAEQQVQGWAKDKPHFPAVRQMMAHLINTDLNAIQTTGQAIGGYVKDGRIDLDAAYNAALYANPETRASVLAEEQAKKAAAQKDAVQKARNAAVSVRTGTPTGPTAANGKGEPKFKSVRDALKAAVEEVRSR